MLLADKRERILSLLRGMSRHPLPDENAVWHEIETALAHVDSGKANGKSKQELDDCVYALALVYTHYVGAMPAFSNSDRQTRFEKFVLTVPMPIEFRVTPNRIKASIRRLDAKHNPSFARDLQRMADLHAPEQRPAPMAARENI